MVLIRTIYGYIKVVNKCRHFWERRVYMAKTVTPDAKTQDQKLV